MEFYQLLGFEVKKTVEHGGQTQWAWLQHGGADLMVATFGAADESGSAGHFVLHVRAGCGCVSGPSSKPTA